MKAAFSCGIVSRFWVETDFEGFHASEPAGNLSGGDDNGLEAGHLSDAAAAAAYRTNPNLPD